MASRKDRIIETSVVAVGAAGITTALWFAAKMHRERTGVDLTTPAVIVGPPLGSVLLRLIMTD